LGTIELRIESGCGVPGGKFDDFNTMLKIATEYNMFHESGFYILDEIRGK
jgi:hypothetical protein